uniref:Uncharacterized protein n=1 Tax=Anguilla anguilla TaxID=7936 RepID=A0A0E9UZD6_ANGAN
MPLPCKSCRQDQCFLSKQFIEIWRIK